MAIFASVLVYLFCGNEKEGRTDMEFDKTVPFDKGNTENSSGGYVPASFLNYGHLLKGRYSVESVLGEGGFGITYACRDTTLDMKVAIKEYFPQGFVTRDTNYSPTITYTASTSGRGFIEKGREQFLQEAKILAKFSGEKGVVNVRDFFEENNTAYIVMEFLDGMDLKQILKQRGKIPAPEAVRMLMPVMESLEKIHRQGLIHRDISPDNIRMAGNTVKLLDFGAARNVAFGENKSMTVVLKHGYAPIEQYSSSGVQGPWTDVYALCATLYLCITGKRPVDAPGRMPTDSLRKPSQLGVTIDPSIENVIMKGLGITKESRYLSVQELMDDFNRALGGMYIPEAPSTVPQQGYPQYTQQYPQTPMTFQPSVHPAPPPQVAPFTQTPPRKKGNKGLGCLIAVIAVVAVFIIMIVVAGVGVGSSVNNKNETVDTYEEDTTSATTTTTETTTEETTTINPRELYLPGELGFCEEYTMYVTESISAFYGPDSAKYARYDSLSADDEVTVQSNSINGWVLVKYGNNRAWVQESSLTNVVPYSQLLDGTVVQLYSEELGSYGRINVYAGPGYGYEIVGEISNGTYSEMLGYSPELDEYWTYYEFSGGVRGWISDDMIFGNENDVDGYGDTTGDIYW